MNKKIKTDAVDSLFDAVLCLQSREECYSFFEDLCTVNELLSLSQRFEVAAMLKDGKTYLEIAEKTGASTATTAGAWWTVAFGLAGKYCIRIRDINTGVDAAQDRLVALLTGT